MPPDGYYEQEAQQEAEAQHQNEMDCQGQAEVEAEFELGPATIVFGKIKDGIFHSESAIHKLK